MMSESEDIPLRGTSTLTGTDTLIPLYPAGHRRAQAGTGRKRRQNKVVSYQLRLKKAITSKTDS